MFNPFFRLTLASFFIVLLSACEVKGTASFFFNTAATPDKRADGEDEEEKNTPIVYQRFSALMKQQCNSCHVGGNAGATSWFSNRPRMQQWRALAYSGSNRILPGNAQQSTLVQRLRSSDPEVRMPPAGLTEEQIQVVTDWINSLDSTPSPEPSDSPSPEPSIPNPGYGSSGPPSTFTTRVMDRKTMYDWFISRFGNSISIFARSNILGRPSRFGGSCSSQFSIESGTNHYCEETITLDGVQLIVPMVPDPDLGREGLRTKTCREALLTPGAASRIYHALRSLPDFRDKQDLEIRTLLGSQAVPSQDQLKSMYKVFYGFREPGSTVLENLQELAEAAHEPSVNVVNPSVYLDRRHEPWRYVLLALCYGADNQFL